LGGRTDYSVVTPKKVSPQEAADLADPERAVIGRGLLRARQLSHHRADPGPGRAAHAGRNSGALTWIYSDDGKTKWRINDRGQDACSYFFPDGKRVIFTSTRDHTDMPIGNWSDQNNYPQGAELYIADIDGGNRKRLTNNTYYEAEGVGLARWSEDRVYPPGRGALDST
jgi:hypothetical protein